MLMFRRTHRRVVEELQRIIENRRDECLRSTEARLRLQIRLELVEQARAKADTDAAYWRTRAEKFIDQIGVASGTLSSPAMEPPREATADDVRTIFSALGTSEINRDNPPPGAATSAPVLREIDSAAAQAALRDALDAI
jgi:hypothetical protein